MSFGEASREFKIVPPKRARSFSKGNNGKNRVRSFKNLKNHWTRKAPIYMKAS
jgi:hypothetical protein